MQADPTRCDHTPNHADPPPAHADPPPAHPVFALSDRFVDEFAALTPIEATLAGLAGHDHRWGDLGPDGITARTAWWRRMHQDILALPGADDARERLAVRVLRTLVEDQLARIEHDDHLRDITHLASTVPAMREAVDVQDITTEAGVLALLARLETFPDALADWRASVQLGLDRGVVVARRQVESVIDQLHTAADTDGAYPRRVDALAQAAPGHAARARAAVPHIVEACRATARFLEETYLPRASTTDGVGRERYLRAARELLGMRLDPEEAYAWAWTELDRLLARAKEVAARIDPDRDLHHVLDVLRTDPRYAADSPDDFRERMLARQYDALAWLAGEHFDVPEPVGDIEVNLAPPGSALGASYVPPSEDFSRPGSIWWSLGHRQRIPLFVEVSTAYHEGFPGHHLQVGIQLTLGEQLSRAHRTLVWNPGYGEGWALYTERLMDELGAFDEPQYLLGYLTSALLRAVRVVVDIGLHLDLPIPADAPFHPGASWDFAVAVEALEDLAALDHDYAVSEVTRYLGWPAQAITYALGERLILQLREERRRNEGAAFDLKGFHADVLGSGPVGLDHLRELVRSPPPR
jgi:uncharacterized protein (DUF885 family)